MPSRATTRRLAFLAVVVALAAVVGVFPPKANAFVHVSEPVVETACWATACPGGDGVAFVDLLNGNYTWGSIDPIRKPLMELEEAAQVLPKPRWIPALTTVVLSLEAFEIGWKIGSTVNTKWLHIAGVGLGTFQTQSALRGVRWRYITAPASCSQTLGSGYYLEWYDGANWNCGATDITTGTNCPPWSTFAQQRWADYLSRVASTSGETVVNGTSGCGASSYVFMKTPAQYDDAYELDEALQPLTGQPFGIWTGWADPASGAGVTKTAPGYGSGPTNPQPQAGPTQTTADGFPDEERHRVDCELDPAHYACPEPAAGGSGWSSSGGWRGSDGGVITGPNEYNCKFDDDLGGLALWQSLRAENPAAYDEACEEAWNALKAAGHIDADGYPSAAARVAPRRLIRGEYLTNETVVEGLTADGSQITEWAKVSSPEIETSSAPAEAHWYQKTADQTVWLERDYFVIFKSFL
jgi:hypothetical protein